MVLYAYINKRRKIAFTMSDIFNCNPLINRSVIKTIFLSTLILFSFLAISQENNDQTLTNASAIETKQSIVKTSKKTQSKNILEKANSYYKNKNYNDAIELYTQHLKYLQGTDQTTQKRLGETYTQIAESYKRVKNREKSVVFYKKSLDIFTILNDKKLMARTLKTLAETERYLGNLIIALNYSTQSLEIYETINDPKGQARALMAAGIIYRHIGRYEKSLMHIRQAYLYYKEVNDHNGIAKASNEMGNIYIRLEQFKLAKFFFQETIKIPEEQLELKTIAAALRSMAVIEFKHENYQRAMFHAKKAYQIYQEKNEKLKESVTARIIANIYRAQKQDINAIDYYQRSMSIAIEENSEKQQIEAQLPLAELLIVQDVNKAINLLTSALDIAIKIKDKKQEFHGYHKLSIAEEYRNNFEKALYYAKKEIALAKVIQKIAEEKEITLAKATLYSHKIEIELESLREKSKLNELELAKKNDEIEIGDQSRTINELKLTKDKYASVALTFLLVIFILLGLVIYRRFIASKKHNKKLNYLASRDSLTNCYNRRSLFEFMDEYRCKTKVRSRVLYNYGGYRPL